MAFSNTVRLGFIDVRDPSINKEKQYEVLANINTRHRSVSCLQSCAFEYMVWTNDVEYTPFSLILMRIFLYGAWL
jgi:hypothetical protein